MMASKRHSERIATTHNHLLLQQILLRKPFAGSSEKYTTVAWKGVKAVLRKRGACFDAKERYEQLLTAFRNDPDPGTKLDPTTQKLLKDIQRDLVSCPLVRQPACQPAQSPSTQAPAADAAAATAAASSPTAQSTRAPQTPSPAEAHATPTPDAPPSKPRAKHTVKRSKKINDHEPAAKRPRGRPRTSSAREAPVAAVEAPIDDGRGVEIPVGPNGTAVDASPDSSGGGVVAVSVAAQSRSDLIRTVAECLAVGERETTGVMEVLNGVLESQRERQRYAAQAVAKLAQLR